MNIVYRGHIGPTPFSEYKVYGPILHRKQNRRMICLVGRGTNRTTISYAKFLMSVHIGRILTREEEVDHINNDKLDDRVDNYQILDRLTNQLKSIKPQTILKCVCTWCGKEFTRRKGIEPGINGKKSFCSRSCGAKNQWNR